MSAMATAAVLALLGNPECFPVTNDVPGLRDHVIATLQVESDHDPLAINVNCPGGAKACPGSGARRSATKDTAITTAKALLGEGRSIDLGLMQINSANLAAHGLSVETAFDACANLKAGTEHLADDYRAAWRAAHSLYNTGSLTAGIANGYVQKIEAAHQVLMRSTSKVASPTPTETPTPQQPSEDIDLFATARSRPPALLQFDDK
jgi:type IV secretion system protein VirB1